MIRMYWYERCGTCRAAKRWLDARGVDVELVDITHTPPPRLVFEAALASGYRLAELLNRSGELYRAMRLKDKLPHLSSGDVVGLLTRHGKLVKRPVLTDGMRVTVGFNETRFHTTWRAPRATRRPPAAARPPATARR